MMYIAKCSQISHQKRKSLCANKNIIEKNAIFDKTLNVIYKNLNLHFEPLRIKTNIHFFSKYRQIF
jgi:hypothetical protein